MTQPAQRSTGGRIVVRVLVFMVTLGFLLGVYKYFGQGEQIWSPDWLGNAWESVTNWLQWNHDTTENIVEKVPNLQITLPTSPTITLPSSLATP